MALIRAVAGIMPTVAEAAFVAENATLIGDVVLAPLSSIWYGVVLRGDCGRIRIGARSNIQDNSCIHMTTGLSHTEVGEDVTVGHGVILHGASIADRALIGMGSVLLDNVEIGEESVVAAGSVVPPRMKVPPRVLIRGAPARIIRPVTEEERKLGLEGALAYLELARLHRA